jgi:hypothetical protein
MKSCAEHISRLIRCVRCCEELVCIGRWCSRIAMNIIKDVSHAKVLGRYKWHRQICYTPLLSHGHFEDGA